MKTLGLILLSFITLLLSSWVNANFLLAPFMVVGFIIITLIFNYYNLFTGISNRWITSFIVMAPVLFYRITSVVILISNPESTLLSNNNLLMHYLMLALAVVQLGICYLILKEGKRRIV